MGAQSSRIIWGKDKLDSNENETTAISLYDTNVIYICGNYAIKDDTTTSERKKIAEDYHLYYCKAEETGGDWRDEDWQLQAGVKNWYLLANSKSFKKGARVLKEDTKGDFETLKLYKCIVDKTTPGKGFIPEEWEVVYQDVGLAWMPRDHKDIYYDDGKNAVKWHKKMYFVPEYIGNEVDLEIILFMEDWQYHFGDRVLFKHPTNGLGCYKFIDHYPYKGEWQPSKWEFQSKVKEYETYISYAKDSEMFKKTLVVYNVIISQFDIENLQIKYSTNKYTIAVINKSEDIEQLSGFHDTRYLTRIFKGETIYGLYRCKVTTDGSYFNRDDWTLQTHEAIMVHNHIYNPSEKDIKMWAYGNSYEVDDVCIWPGVENSPTFCLNACIKPIISSTGWNAPPNEEYWITLDQTIDMPDVYRVYRANKDISASENSHFDHNKWAIVTQKTESDYDLYGLVWEKYGLPDGGGIPFFYPITVLGTEYGTFSKKKQDCRLNNFFPFTVSDSRLSLGPTNTSTWEGDDVSIASPNKIVCSNNYYIAYHSNITRDSIIDYEDIFVSHDSKDWNTIVIDDRAARIEIVPCDDGFMYARVKQTAGSTISTVTIVKILVDIDGTKLSEDILDDDIPYNNVPKNKFLVNYFAYDRKACYTDGTITNFEYYNSSFTDKSGTHICAVTFSEYVDYTSQLIRYNGALIKLHINTLNVITFWNETSDITEPIPYPRSNYPYSLDDEYAYLARTVNDGTSYDMILWSLKMDGSEYEEIMHVSNEQYYDGGSVKNIPYYNRESCRLSHLNVNVDKLILRNKEITPYQNSPQVINGDTIVLTFDPKKYYNLGFGSSNSGHPAKSLGLFITEYVELVVQETGALRHYCICVYIANYSGENFEDLINGNFSGDGSFFWISSTEEPYGGPFYGGPDQGGF